MIKGIKLKNFKCFQQQRHFEFSKINLLTGINGRGKSSLLQAILLLSQSTNKFNRLEKLSLNGKHINLGNFEDIKNSDSIKGDLINLELTINDLMEVSFNLTENENDIMSALLTEVKYTSLKQIPEFDTWREKISTLQENLKLDLDSEVSKVIPDINSMVFNEFMSKIHYISADRLGPVKYVDKTSLSDFISVGPQGEFTINVLAKDNLPLVDEKLYLGIDAHSVIQQTEEWLGYILEGAKIEIKGKESTSSVLYMILNNKANAYKYKPTNVGFGYSYILPLIVTGLIAKPNEIIIVENPEAHLHPRAQSKISEFFAKVASCGVQVFIESHSEHILNGLRVSTLNPKIGIKYNELAIHYFNESFDSEKLTMNEKGKIPNWPNGFFDQQEIDLANIFKFSK
jgi:predicted ATPase